VFVWGVWWWGWVVLPISVTLEMGGKKYFSVN